MNNKWTSTAILLALSLVLFALGFACALMLGLPGLGRKIVIGLTPMALLWLGAGIELGRARITRTWLRRLIAVGAFAGLPSLLIIVLPVAVFLFFAPAIFPRSPAWQTFQPLPEQPTEIAAGDFRYVYVRTVSGKIYTRAVDKSADGWQQAREPLAIATEYFTRPLAGAPENNPPPGKTISTLNLEYYGPSETSSEIHYVVLSDGSVWWLAFERPDKSFQLLIVLLIPALAVLGLLASVPFWLGVCVIVLMRRKTHVTA